MSRIAAIRDYFKGRVNALCEGDVVPAFPNVAQKSTTPRLEVGVTTAVQARPTIRGDRYLEVGQCQVSVVVKSDEGEAKALELAQCLFDAFVPGPIHRVGTTLEPAHLQITGVPDIQPGYADETEYRIPVLIPYEAWWHRVDTSSGTG